MEPGSALDLVALLGEGNALAGDCLVEIRDGRDVLVDDRLIDQRPKGFGGLQLWTIGRQINKANTIWDCQIGCAMPSRIVKHEQDDACHARFGFPRKGFEQSLEKFLRHTVGQIPEGFAGGR